MVVSVHELEITQVELVIELNGVDLEWVWVNGSATLQERGLAF